MSVIRDVKFYASENLLEAELTCHYCERFAGYKTISAGEMADLLIQEISLENYIGEEVFCSERCQIETIRHH